MRIQMRSFGLILLMAALALPLSASVGAGPSPAARLSSLSGAAGSGGSPQVPHILTLRQQAEVWNASLQERLERILPAIMREEGIDMWLVICRENNEDPVYFSLVPFTTLYASRLQILVFHDRGAAGFDRFSVNFRQMGDWYKSVWVPSKMDQWARLAEVIRERNPKVIGIDESEVDHYGDGLTASLKASLVKAIGPEYAKRLKSAERLAVRVLERRTPQELALYPQVVAVAHSIIAEAFSNRVITPSVTTTDDVVWWMRQRSLELGFTNWFHPSVSIQRPKDSPFGGSTVIQRGDLLHCDFGIVYMNLCTDTQQQAYVLKEGETEAPKGLQAALASANRLQDIHMEELRIGRTGNQVLASALQRARAEGLRPSIYSHPLGVHGHAAGPPVGMVDKQDGVPGDGDYPLFADTVHSIELNNRADVPEWGNQEVRIALEQDAVLLKTGPRFIDVRQTSFHLVR
ncbi:MAG: M24 family metallopeptidase [Vicinamibacterales bacterium]